MSQFDDTSDRILSLQDQAQFDNECQDTVNNIGFVPTFKAGEVVASILTEVLIESFDGLDLDGRETYTVILPEVHRTKDDRLYNRSKAVIVPRLVLSGPAL
jgi:hypothetical protein